MKDKVTAVRITRLEFTVANIHLLFFPVIFILEISTRSQILICIQLNSTLSLILVSFTLHHSVDQGNDLAFSSKFRVNIYADGTVRWAPGFRLRTQCQLDLTSFPYDSQQCDIIFINWVYTASGVMLNVDKYPISMRPYTPNGEWHLVNITGFEDNKWYNATTGEGFPIVVFRLHLQRKPGYFVLSVIIPTVIMTLIAALVFCLPSEAGEKVSLGISVLLSFSVLLLVVSDNMPRSSDVTPRVCK